MWQGEAGWLAEERRSRDECLRGCCVPSVLITQPDDSIWCHPDATKFTTATTGTQCKYSLPLYCLQNTTYYYLLYNLHCLRLMTVTEVVKMCRREKEFKVGQDLIRAMWSEGTKGDFPFFAFWLFSFTPSGDKNDTFFIYNNTRIF